MFDIMDSLSESEVDFEEINIWKPKKKAKSTSSQEHNKDKVDQVNNKQETSHKFETRLENVKEKIQKQIEIDYKLEQRREKRKNERLMKKISRDTSLWKTIQEELEQNDGDKDNSDTQKNSPESWQEVKSYLTVNDHLTGPVSHGKYGPKTELESMIDKAIDDGDFDKAEQLSDHLSNREFGTKITNAFAAKRFAEIKAEEDAILKAKKLKKLKWGFEQKERWEMKGNM